MIPVARQYGFFNHAIGSPELRLSAVADANGDGRVDLALPRADRLGLKIITLADGDIRAIAAVPLPDRIDKLEIRPDGIDRLNMSTATGYLKDHGKLQFFNYTLIHQLRGVPGYFAGKDPEEVCKGRQQPDPDWETNKGIPPVYGYWGH